MSGNAKPPRGRRWIIWGFVLAGVLVFAGANAHLIYVAFESQPECVARGENDGYRAAKPAC
jgi:hypothetical protein